MNKDLLQANAGTYDAENNRGWFACISDYNVQPRKFQNIWVNTPDEEYLHLVSGERYTKDIPGTNAFTATWEINEKLPLDSLGAITIIALANSLRKVTKDLQDLQGNIDALCSYSHDGW